MKIFVVIIMMGMAVQVDAQFLLNNPDFDNNLTGWSIDDTPVPVWDPFDIDNAASSGSAWVTNNQISASSDVEILSQCLQQPHTGMHQFGLAAFLPSGQDSTGSVVMRLVSHNNNDCTGGMASSSGHFVVQSNNPNTWVGNLQLAEIPNHANSIKFIIAIRKTENFGTLNAYVDAAVLENIDHIFASQFE